MLKSTKEETGIRFVRLFQFIIGTISIGILIARLRSLLP